MNFDLVQVLFLVVAFIAVGSTVMMLLMKNAVYSALFLIVTMICIAFMFLLLNAPFLAMVQIAVYAGAIMVLFLFVIMLLGAEKAEDNDIQEFRWQGPLAIAVVFAFITMMGITLYVASAPDSEALEQPVAQFRVGNVAADAGNFDIYVNGELLAEDSGFGDVTDFQQREAGTYTVTFNPAGLNAALVTQELILESGDSVTLLTTGEGRLPQVAVIEEDLSEVGTARSGRVTIFNALTQPISLVEIQSEGSTTDRRFDPVVAEIAPNTAAAAVVLPEGDYGNWAFVRSDFSGGLNASDWSQRYVLERLQSFDVNRDTKQLVIVAAQRQFDESLRVVSIPLMTAAVPPFGGPHIVGFQLLTTYMLPFQAIAFLLLVAMIGAVVLTHKPADAARTRRDQRRKVSRPLTAVIAAQTGQEVLSASESSPETPQPQSGD